MKQKNVSGQELTIPGVGVVKAGETVELPESFHNVNFERVGPRRTEKPSEAKE